MLSDKRVNISLTGGNTPKGMYNILLEKLGKISFDTNQIHYYNFDEIPVKGERYGLTMSSLKKEFYDPATISEENIHELNVENFKGYDKKIQADGGLDLVVMGIGADGHFCGNMPGYTSFDKETFEINIQKGDEMYDVLYELLGKEPSNLWT